MKITRGRRIVSAVVVALLIAEVPVVALAADKPTSLTVAPSATVARTGARVLVRGTVGADEARQVVLQRLVGRAWRDVDEVSTDDTYALTVPSDKSGMFSFRVYVPATDSRAATTSKPFTIGFGLGETSDYALLTTPPVRWDPCTPIGYRVNLEGAPKSGLNDIKSAVSLAAAASGLTMRYRGTTAVVPGATGADVPEMYPADTQLVIAWAAPGKTDLLKPRSNVLGVGGVFFDRTPQKIGKATWLRSVQGYVVLNTDKDLPGGFGMGRSSGDLGTWGQVIMHEVGHTLGLAHPKDAPEQIMNPETTRKAAAWGLGDLSGLRKVGRGAGCFVGAPDTDIDDDSAVAAAEPSRMMAGQAAPRRPARPVTVSRTR